ncbi:hypothetical protein [Schauerella aestuarii]|uniref:hypothetical protein n=1 Tax=Schauerella aestuarii TaxID=2511204 RepID=UPI00136EEF6C|nr:hypothetical protein [Achromobacter aestuarii]MYZ42093.1 hypothetical protein [Achromobacter aestuarii]
MTLTPTLPVQHLDPSYISANIDERFRPFFLISAADIPIAMKDTIDSLCVAVNLFGERVRFRVAKHLVVGGSPFNIELASGSLLYTPKKETIHVNIEEYIFLDVNKAQALSKNIRIATFVEEFVHAFMNITDEDLTAKVVCLIYPQVQFIEGQYFDIGAIAEPSGFGLPPSQTIP